MQCSAKWTIGGLGANLNNKSYIKQVKKKYIATYNDASSVTACNDYLWLLAASEIVSSGYQANDIRICNYNQREVSISITKE